MIVYQIIPFLYSVITLVIVIYAFLYRRWDFNFCLLTSLSCLLVGFGIFVLFQYAPSEYICNATSYVNYTLQKCYWIYNFNPWIQYTWIGIVFSIALIIWSLVLWILQSLRAIYEIEE